MSRLTGAARKILHSGTIISLDERPTVENEEPDSPDPNDSDLLRDELKGETHEHAKPPRLEDEGQSGGQAVSGRGSSSAADAAKNKTGAGSRR